MPQSDSTPKTAHSEAAKPTKGLEGVVAGETSLSLVDGENSRLIYRGIPVQEFVDPSSFEEVTYLLWNAHLPLADELEAFKKKLIQERKLADPIAAVLKLIPKNTHPMAMLRTMVSVIGHFDPEAEDRSVESSWRKAFRLTALVPAVIAGFYRFRNGQGLISPDPKLSHAANFLYMMHGELPGPEMIKALDAYLILLADHGFNASTFSARVTSSTQSDMYSAVTAAVGTLKGDLHGSANQRAMEMILDIGTPEKADEYILNLLKQKKKVMGFGHRIYKKEDPRAGAFRKIAEALCEKTKNTKYMEISNRVEKVMWKEKQIPCNVDFFSASVLYVLGFPVDFFTTVFAASRVAGWTAHVIEQQTDNRLIRPQAAYIGASDQHYLAIEKRKR